MSLITDEGSRSAAEMFDLPLINPASVFGKVIIQLFDEVRGENIAYVLLQCSMFIKMDASRTAKIVSTQTLRCIITDSYLPEIWLDTSDV